MYKNKNKTEMYKNKTEMYKNKTKNKLYYSIYGITGLVFLTLQNMLSFPT
jgi:hypothetical protein